MRRPEEAEKRLPQEILQQALPRRLNSILKLVSPPAGSM
jgi:hypothetical protein